MSLSFVSSAVQTATSDGGFEEKAIESKETEAVNRRNAHKPLFEQLRSNREEDQEKKDEIQRQIMLNTGALDDEEAAHLDSLQQQQNDRERKIQERTRNELDNFRAAKALRRQNAADSNPNDEEIISMKPFETLKMKEQGKSIPTASNLPMIKVKKRKRRINQNETTPNLENSDKRKSLKPSSSPQEDLNDGVKKNSSPNETMKKKNTSNSIIQNDTSGNGLGGLLAGYGSSSDEE